MTSPRLEIGSPLIWSPGYLTFKINWSVLGRDYTMNGRYKSPIYRFKLNLWGFRIRRRRGLYDICSGRFRASEVPKSLIMQSMVRRSYWKYRLPKVNHSQHGNRKKSSLAFLTCHTLLFLLAEKGWCLSWKSSQERWDQCVLLWRPPALKIYAVMLWEKIRAFVGAAVPWLVNKTNDEPDGVDTLPIDNLLSQCAYSLNV